MSTHASTSVAPIPQRVRTVVVDDEPLAREGLRMLLGTDPTIELVGEAASGREAVALVRRARPDLLLLDVQMPELSGFDVLEALAPDPLPAVIFVTAYDRFALRAFEVHAVDYLLKPYEDDRFFDALRRAKAHLRMAQVSDLSQQLLAMLATYRRGAASGDPGAFSAGVAAGAPGRIAIKDAGRVVFLNIGEIDWIEAADYYVQIHTGSKSFLHRETMQNLEARLDPEQFLRIHRSAIVNRDRIRELRREGRDLLVVLPAGRELRVSRSQRDKLQRML